VAAGPAPEGRAGQLEGSRRGGHECVDLDIPPLSYSPCFPQNPIPASWRLHLSSHLQQAPPHPPSIAPCPHLPGPLCPHPLAGAQVPVWAALTQRPGAGLRQTTPHWTPFKLLQALKLGLEPERKY
jgi:hypothetical protein